MLDLSASLIIQIHGQQESERFKSVLKIVGNAEQERNKIIHSLWSGGWGTGVTRTKHTAKRRKGLHTQIEEYGRDDLFKSARKITVAIHEVEKYRESLGYSIDN